MYDSTTTGGRKRRWLGAAGLLAAGVIGGGVLTSALAAYASSNSSTASGSTAAASSSAAARPPGPGGAQPVRPGEKSVSGATAATLRAAALKVVPGGAVYRIETDAGDGVYEVHMTKADGSVVTVKFGKNLKVTKVEGGMGTGDPAPSGQGSPGAAA
ncbi:MAG: hypothetical protein ACTHPS_04350 [Streptosporangiaceae bacterium]